MIIYYSSLELDRIWYLHMQSELWPLLDTLVAARDVDALTIILAGDEMAEPDFGRAMDKHLNRLRHQILQLAEYCDLTTLTDVLDAARVAAGRHA